MLALFLVKEEEEAEVGLQGMTMMEVAMAMEMANLMVIMATMI